MGHLPRPPPQPQVAICLPPRGSHALAEPDVKPRQRQEGPRAAGAALEGQSPPGPGWARGQMPVPSHQGGLRFLTLRSHGPAQGAEEARQTPGTYRPSEAWLERGALAWGFAWAA